MPIKKRPRSGTGKRFQALVRKMSVRRGGAKKGSSSAGPKIMKKRRSGSSSSHCR